MKCEILSPAGSEKCAAAAVNSGCDAIYIGGRAFNARRFADSPSDEQLREIIRQAHLRGVKVHITLNTLYKDNELNDVLSFASKMYSYGADAFIIQDLGFFSLVKAYFPLISAHASTQLTIHSPAQAQFFISLGFDRIVLGRELSLKEVREIVKSTDAETEVFVHGALCVSYSGRCLMSSMLGGRSGNRGSCAQPCRKSYRLVSESGTAAEGCLLSPKDNCMIEHTGELLGSGVTSWKIEGRMKSPEYVALVTAMYRKYADNPSAVAPYDKKRLTQIFNRGGELGTGCWFSHSGKSLISDSPKNTGICIGTVSRTGGKSCTIHLTDSVCRGDGIEIWTKGKHTGTSISEDARAGEYITVRTDAPTAKGDLVYKTYDKALSDSLKNCCSTYTRRSKVKAGLTARAGAPLVLRLTHESGVSIECEGPVPEAALNSPIHFDDLTGQLSKTGNTPFEIEFEDGSCEDLYVPLSALKQFKRNACDKLERAVEEHFSRERVHTEYTPSSTASAANTRLAVQLYDSTLADTVLEFDNIDIYCELDSYSIKNAERLIKKAHSMGSRLFFALPAAEKSDTREQNAAYIDRLEGTELDGYLMRNLYKINTKKELIGDFTLNTFNSAALALLKHYFGRVALSPELNLKELKPLCGIGTEVVAYGRLPLMTTQHCPVGVHMAHKHGGKYCGMKDTHAKCMLIDEKNAAFPIITQCTGCTALIFNSSPIYTADKFGDILKLENESIRLTFTTESSDEIRSMIKLYISALAGEKITARPENITRGHFYRGVM